MKIAIEIKEENFIELCGAQCLVLCGQIEVFYITDTYMKLFQIKILYFFVY